MNKTEGYSKFSILKVGGYCEKTHSAMATTNFNSISIIGMYGRNYRLTDVTNVS